MGIAVAVLCVALYLGNELSLLPLASAPDPETKNRDAFFALVLGFSLVAGAGAWTSIFLQGVFRPLPLNISQWSAADQVASVGLMMPGIAASSGVLFALSGLPHSGWESSLASMFDLAGLIFKASGTGFGLFLGAVAYFGTMLHRPVPATTS